MQQLDRYDPPPHGGPLGVVGVDDGVGPMALGLGGECLHDPTNQQSSRGQNQQQHPRALREMPRTDVGPMPRGPEVRHPVVEQVSQTPFVANSVSFDSRRRMLIITGPSGVGKTSLAQAGIIARLREQEQWQVIALRPGWPSMFRQYWKKPDIYRSKFVGASEDAMPDELRLSLAGDARVADRIPDRVAAQRARL